MVGLTYAFGKSRPLKLQIETYGTSNLSDTEISCIVESHYPMSLEAIMSHMELRRPLYSHTSVYGHFGRDDIAFPWEQTEFADHFRKEA